MKKLLAVFALVAVLGLNAAAQSPVKLSLYDDIAWPQTSKANVVLGLVDNNTPTVHGLDWNFISARSEEMYGLKGALAYVRSYELRGVQGAIYNSAKEVIGAQFGLLNVADTVTGVQWGLVNVSDREVTGAQLGAVNFAQSMTGFQWGLYNQAQNFKGLQLGFVNNITSIDRGLQIGLVNIIKNGGWFPGMVLVNGRF